MIVWWMMYGSKPSAKLCAEECAEECAQQKSVEETITKSAEEEATTKTAEELPNAVVKSDAFAKIKGNYKIIKGQLGPKPLPVPVIILIDFTPDKKIMTMAIVNEQTSKTIHVMRAMLASDINAPKVLFRGQGPGGNFENEKSIYYENNQIHFTDTGLVMQKIAKN